MLTTMLNLVEAFDFNIKYNAYKWVKHLAKKVQNNSELYNTKIFRNLILHIQ